MKIPFPLKWLLFCVALVACSALRYHASIYFPSDNILGKLYYPMKGNQAHVLHLCQTSFVIKFKDRTCVASLTPSECALTENERGANLYIAAVPDIYMFGNSAGYYQEITNLADCLRKKPVIEDTCSSIDDTDLNNDNTNRWMAGNCHIPGKRGPKI